MAVGMIRCYIVLVFGIVTAPDWTTGVQIPVAAKHPDWLPD